MRAQTSRLLKLRDGETDLAAVERLVVALDAVARTPPSTEMMNEALSSGSGYGDAVRFRAVVQSLARTLHSALQVEAVSVDLFYARERERGGLKLTAASGLGSLVTRDGNTVRSDDSIAGSCFLRGEFEAVEDIPRDERASPERVALWRQYLESGELRDGMFGPFKTAVECSGVLQIFNLLPPEPSRRSAKVNPMNQRDVPEFQRIARLFEMFLHIAWSEYQLHLLLGLSEATVGERDVGSVADSVCRRAVISTNARAACLYLSDKGPAPRSDLHGSFGVARDRGDEPSPDLLHEMERIQNAGDPERVAPIHAAHWAAGLPGAQVPGSCLAAPLDSEWLTGVLFIHSPADDHFAQISDEKCDLLVRFAEAACDRVAAAQTRDRIDDYVARAAHSFRSPLSLVVSDVRGIEQDLEMWAHTLPSKRKQEVRQALEEAKESAQFALRRVDSLLMRLPQAVDILGLDLRATRVADVLSRYRNYYARAAAQKGVRLIVEPTIETLPIIPADANKLGVALENVIDNALKYAAKGQFVRIEGHAHKRTIQIIVKDRGRGIPPSELEGVFMGMRRVRVLDPNEYVPGTGLGLQEARAIIEKHGGKISAHSESVTSNPERAKTLHDWMTVFTITLPRERAPL